jgi:hypothetical protein
MTRQHFPELARGYGGAPIGSSITTAATNARQSTGRRRHGLELAQVQERLVNVNTLIYGKVYFPSRSNSLKALGHLVGAT